MTQDTDGKDPSNTQGMETVAIGNMHQFVHLLFRWHSRQVKELEHMLKIPPGNVVEFENKDYKLEGDLLQGFIIGVNLSLMQLGTLPFKAEVDNDAAGSGTSASAGPAGAGSGPVLEPKPSTSKH